MKKIAPALLLLFLTAIAAVSLMTFGLMSNSVAFASADTRSVTTKKDDESPFSNLEPHAASVSWVLDSMSPQQVLDTIKKAQSDQLKWIKLPTSGLSEKNFACKPLNLKKPTRAARKAFAQGEELRYGVEAKRHYAIAAKDGYWRAAARLVMLNLEDEIWELALPPTAWLLNNDVPAGYNKVADIMRARGEPVPSPLAFSFRWRAALEGDPVALSMVAEHLQQKGENDFAQKLLDCATVNKRSLW